MKFSKLPKDSTVEQRLKELPHGAGNYPGYDSVYTKLKEASNHLAANSYLSEDHINTMAILGCGHEETMKYHLAICRSNGWIK